MEDWTGFTHQPEASRRSATLLGELTEDLYVRMRADTDIEIGFKPTVTIGQPVAKAAA